MEKEELEKDNSNLEITIEELNQKINDLMEEMKICDFVLIISKNKETHNGKECPAKSP